MMTRTVPTALAVLAVLGATAWGQAQRPTGAGTSGVRDKAGMFSTEAVEKANDVLREVNAEGRWQVLIETQDDLGGRSPKEAALALAEASRVHGLVILIDKKDRKFWLEPSRSAEQTFPEAERTRIKEAFTRSFARKDFDRGLLDAVDEIRNAALKVGVRDAAKMFSADAVAKADEALKQVRKASRWRAVIETVESLGGKAVSEVAAANARVLQVPGLYILIARDEHKVFVEPSASAAKVFNRQTVSEIEEVIVNAFKAKAFDKGLLNAVAAIRRDTGDADAEVFKDDAPGSSPTPSTSKEDLRTASTPPAQIPGPAPQGRGDGGGSGSFLPMLLLGGGAVLLVLWLLSRGFRGSTTAPAQPGAGPGPYGPGQPSGYPPTPSQPQVNPGPRPGAAPGYGQPPAPAPGYGYGQPPAPAPGYGYGPPPQPQGGGAGGGFVSGALGGAAGAIAGNILYDKFGRPHESHEIPHTQAGGVASPEGGNWAGVGAGAGAGGGLGAPGGEPPVESYDPNAGVGGDWGSAPDSGSPMPEPDQAGAGGDWGATETSNDPGAGGDWGAPETSDDPGAGGDWISEPETGGAEEGGDWGSGGDAGNDNQEGSW